MIAVIPARGGSREVRRKNLAVVDGKPLLCHIADTLQGMGTRVVVSTEDPEVASVAKVHGYEVHDRAPELAADDVPVSAVAESVVADLGYAGPVIIAQPTCPFVTQETLGRLINMIGATINLDGKPTDSVVDAATLAYRNTHILRDDKRGRFAKPANRQFIDDDLWTEIGVRVFAKGVPFDTNPPVFVGVEGREAFDVDTIHELRAAQTTRHTIEFAVTGNERVGSGHVKRCLDLANELQHHEIVFSVHDSDDWVYEWIQKAEWFIGLAHAEATIANVDLVIIDQLDTTTKQVAGYKANGSKVVTIEDQGLGARNADLVVNALYLRSDRLKPETTYNQEWGPKWADLRPEFVGLPDFKVWDTKRVLVMFGGTDPSHLGERIEKWTGALGNDVTWIQPHAKVSVAWEMMNHDLLITSAGRTVYEAAAVGIPTIVIAQNARETSHAHLGVGNLYLGVGSVVTDDQIVQTVDRLLQDHVLRQELSDMSRASVDGKGLQRISWAVEGLLRGM